MQLTRMQQGPPRLGRRPAATQGGFPLEIRIDPVNSEVFVSLDGQVLTDVVAVEFKAGLVDGRVVQTMHLYLRDGIQSSVLLEALDRLHEIDDTHEDFTMRVHFVPVEEEDDAAGGAE